MKIKKAVIAAAGWGTRFMPVTKALPKEMLPLVNKPLIQYSVEEAVACGAEMVVIVTSTGKRAIEDYFDRSFELERVLSQKGDTRMVEQIRRLSEMADITFVRQKEQLGLGHAVLTCRNVIGDEPFFLLLPDDVFEYGSLVLENMADIYEYYNGSVVAAKRVPKAEVSRYGIVDAEKREERVFGVKDMVEKPAQDRAPSDLAVMGRYILTPDIFDILTETLPGAGGEIQLTDGLKTMARRGDVYAYEFLGERYDAGTPLGWLKTTFTIALKDPVLGPEMKTFWGKYSSGGDILIKTEEENIAKSVALSNVQS